MADIDPFQINANMSNSESGIFTSRSIISILSSSNCISKIISIIIEMIVLNFSWRAHSNDDFNSSGVHVS